MKNFSPIEVGAGQATAVLAPPRAADIVAQATSIFPNVTVNFADDDDRVVRSLRARMVADHNITHLVMPATTVDSSGERASRNGFGRHVKLMWLFSGSMVYQDAHRSLAVSTGEMIVLPMDRTYRLVMDAGFEGLVLVFDSAMTPVWRAASGRACDRVIGADGAIAAAAAGASALLRHADGGPADRLAVQSVVDLALAAIMAGGDEASSLALHSSGLRRARSLMSHYIADETYGPDRLARDLGLSRRSLYNRFASFGLTPAGFIRRERLEHARRQILEDRTCRLSLGTIALNSGFSDGARFSHAFKAAYGMAPSQLRAREI